MTTINFPASPTLGDTYTFGGKTWRFNGIGWALKQASAPLLTADLTLYVRTADGNDANDGSANDSGHAFATVQHAVNAVCAFNLGGHDVTISVLGAVAENLLLGNYAGATGTVDAIWATKTGPKIVGNRASLIAFSSADAGDNAVNNDGCYCPWLIDGFAFSYSGTTNGTAAISATGKAPIYIGKVAFGAWVGGYHMVGAVRATENYSITGGALAHRTVNGATSAQDHPNYAPMTVTITGSPTFSDAFAAVSGAAFLEGYGVTYSGALTTTVRYDVTVNGVIQTYGSGATYFPGTTLAGVTSTGGVYA